MSGADLVFEPVSAAVGARVSGADLTKPLSEGHRRQIIGGLHRYGMLLFRGQKLSDRDVVRFSAYIGHPEIYALRPEIRVEDCPELVNIANIRDENGRLIGLPESGRQWHSDLQFKAEPSIASALYCVECEAGDTEFSGMAAVYDAMPAPLKQRLAGLKGVNSYVIYNERYGNNARKMTEEQKRQVPDVEHPIVLSHPVSGRKALYVSEGMTARIAGLSPAESDALIQELFAFSTRPEFLYRHVWQVHDLVLWDNRSTMHRALPFDQKYRRHMKRSTIMRQFDDV
ncbi:MAG: TauD/TfdA family dioxygenase [Alphaproteobacteria bacterium]|nr:TauD/TfdA family dioxygenase [Alphaproteobacteria bacterium]